MRSRTLKQALIVAGLLCLATPLSAQQLPAAALPPGVTDALKRAEQYQADGAPKYAIIELKNAVQETPDNAYLRYRLGLLHLDSGDGGAAAKELERAIDLGMTDFDVRLALGRAWLRDGKFSDVAAKLQVSDAPGAQGQAAGNVLIGRARIALGEPEAAREAFRAALIAVPGYSPALVNLAELSLREGNAGLANTFLQEATIGVSADPAEIAALSGHLAQQWGDYAAATRYFQTALQTRPSDIALRRDLASAQIASGAIQEADATLKDLLLDAPRDVGVNHLLSLFAFVKGDYARAAELAQTVSRTLVAVPEPLFIAGASSYFLGAYEQAQEHLAQFVALKPDSVDGRRFLALTQSRRGKPEEAYATLQPIIDQIGNDAVLLGLLGRVAVLTGRQSEGRGYLQRALALNPEDKALRLQLAAAKADGGDRDQGIAELDALASDDQGLEELKLRLAPEYIRRGEFDKALAATGQARKSGTPSAAEGWLIQGLALLGKGDLDAAAKAFNQVLDLKPRDPDAQTGLAEIKLRRGDAEGAQQILKGMLKAHPDQVTIIASLAALEAKTGRTEQAIARLEDGLKQHPESIELRIALIGYVVDRGRTGEAIDLLNGWANLEDPRLLEVRGKVELMADRPGAAAVTFGRLVEVRPEAVEARLALAKALEREKNYAAAAGTLAAARKLDPKRIETRVERARLTLLEPTPSDADLIAAAQDIGELFKTYPTDAHVGEVRGLLAWQLKQPDQAVTLLAAAHAALNSGESAATLAKIQWQAGKGDAALATLSDWVKAHPGDNYARLWLARLQLGAKDLPGAASNLEAALKAGAEGPDLEPALAWALLRTGRVAEATPHALKAYAKSPNAPFAQYAMGLVYLDQGKAADAVNLLRNAAEAAPTDRRTQVDYARALVAAGQRVEARQRLDVLLAGQEQFPERSEAASLRARLGN